MKISHHESFSEFGEVEWNMLERGDFVFADHRFLSSLEDGLCLGRRTGWFPMIFAARDKSGLLGAVPVFSKTNSYGEYIFDWAWAHAAEEAGLAYYPKMVAAIPFTPASGPKFLLTKDLKQADAARSALLEAIALSAKASHSSLHFLFETPNEIEVLREKSYLIRHSYQYHWRNRGWADFTEFLSALRSKRRSEIRRERTLIAQSKVKITCLTGDSVKPEHASIMFAFYLSTIEKMGGHAYLTADFFKAVFERMKDSILFVLATDENDSPLAGSLSFYRGKTLFGRYWGCLDDYKNLHFELCYYQPIDWCLRHHFALFEAGAQGEHKFNRGFVPELTLSAHEIYEPRLRSAIRDFLEREKQSIDELFLDAKDHDPFQRL